MSTTTPDRLDLAIERAEQQVADLHEIRVEYEALRELAPELIGATEVAKLLGIHRTSLSRLRKQGRLPAPVAELAAGPVWLRAQFTFPNTLKEEDQ